MNANELADELNKNAKEERQDFWSDESGWCDVLEKAATMLRQQQAEIDILNGRIERMIEKQSHYEAMAHAGGFEAGRELGMKQERESNNEPVAYRHWMIDEEFPEDSCWEYFDAPTGKDCKECIPLYTHPVKEQEIKEAKYGITTKWDGITTYHETTEPIGKVKELTDEEIYEIAKECKAPWHSHAIDPMMFARAILRKAQEK